MGHHCCSKQKVKRGLWSPEEDEKLVGHITTHGHGCWSSVPKLAGLQRCGKSCRLRWINYLRPDLKRGSFSSHEERVIIDVHRILGNRWAQIAKHLPGRTDNEVKNFWNSCIKKKLMAQGLDPKTHNLIPASRPPNCINSSNLSQFHHHPQESTTPFTISSSIKGFENPKNSSMDMNPPFFTLPHSQPNLQLHESTMPLPSFHCQDPNALMSFHDQNSMDVFDERSCSLDHTNVPSSYIQQEFVDDTCMWASSVDPMVTLKVQDGVIAQQEHGHEQAQEMCRLNFSGDANEEKALDMETSYDSAAFDIALMEAELMPCGMFCNGNSIETLPWD